MRIDLKNCTVYIQGGGVDESIEIKIGDGSVEYTEAKEREYLLNRGVIDDVRNADETPVEVSIAFTWEYLTSISGEDVTPEEALKQSGNAADWTSSDDDTCRPYAVDIVIIHEPECSESTSPLETYTLPDFRWESMPHSFNDSSISVTGKCNVASITPVRSVST